MRHSKIKRLYQVRFANTYFSDVMYKYFVNVGTRKFLHITQISMHRKLESTPVFLPLITYFYFNM